MQVNDFQQLMQLDNLQFQNYYFDIILEERKISFEIDYLQISKKLIKCKHFKQSIKALDKHLEQKIDEANISLNQQYSQQQLKLEKIRVTYMKTKLYIFLQDYDQIIENYKSFRDQLDELDLQQQFEEESAFLDCLMKQKIDIESEIKERQNIKQKIDKILEQAQTSKYTYIISNKWFDILLDYLNTKQINNINDLNPYPGPIDNQDIIQPIDQESQINLINKRYDIYRHMTEHSNYMMLNEDAFNVLHQIYGSIQIIKRLSSVYQVQVCYKHVQVVFQMQEMSKKVQVYLGREDKIEKIKKMVQKSLEQGYAGFIWGRQETNIRDMRVIMVTGSGNDIEGMVKNSGVILETGKRIDDYDVIDGGILVVEVRQSEQYRLQVKQVKQVQQVKENNQQLAIIKKACGNCNKKDDKLLQCNQCQQQYYCNRECQLQAWPSHKSNCKSSKSPIISNCKSSKSSNSIISPPIDHQQPIICGINNLGNTCFMNSALQCFINISTFSQYFKSNQFVQDINTTNVLGSKGQVACAFGQMLKDMCKGSSAISPFGFKRAVDKNAQQFQGYGQQDAMEFINFFIDFLHEDLNRIIDKPYIEEQDFEHFDSEQSYAEYQYSNYKKRNESFIIDNFCGQFKSKIHCFDCGKTQIKFEPYLALSVPIMQSEQQNMNSSTIYLINHFITGTKLPKSIAIEIEENESIQAVANHIHKQSIYGNDQSSFYQLCQIKNSQIIYKMDMQKDNFSNLKKNYGLMILYQLPCGSGIDIELRIQKNKSEVSIPRIIRVQLEDRISVILYQIQQSISYYFNENNIEYQQAGEIQIALKDNQYTSLENKKNNLIADEIPNWQQQDNGIYLMCLRLMTSVNASVLKMNQCSQINVERLKGKQLDLDECLTLFGRSENLDEDNEWYCPQCKELKKAQKTLSIYRYPKQLVVHLKRFRAGKVSKFGYQMIQGGKKINDMVQIPMILKQNNSQYRLTGVVNHYGNAGGGHYTSFTWKEGDWYCQNDGQVYNINKNEVVTQAAYILFYERIDQQMTQ